MTTEERLADIRTRVESDKNKNWAPQFRSREHLEEDRAWLLELVGIEREWSEKKTEHIMMLQERVEELERHFSDNANSEHMPTSGDLL